MVQKFVGWCFMVLLITVNSGFCVTMYIGDKDGFGYGAATGLLNVDGNPADSNSSGLLDPGDALPDLNHNGSVATGSSDDFDFRSAAELSNAANTGLKWTDVALSTSYAGRPGRADDAVFTFTFAVPTVGDADYGKRSLY